MSLYKILGTVGFGLCFAFAWAVFLDKEFNDTSTILVGLGASIVYLINHLYSRYWLDGAETKLERGAGYFVDGAGILYVVVVLGFIGIFIYAAMSG